MLAEYRVPLSRATAVWYEPFVFDRFLPPARLLPGVAILLLTAAGCGCGKEYDRTVWYADGTVEGLEYQSSPIEGRWLHFPGGRRYQLVHHLPARPTQLAAFLSFDEDPPRDDFTLGTGSIAVFEEVTDETITIHNDTCAAYYLRVVASVPDAISSP